jgi:hypothetical protein
MSLTLHIWIGKQLTIIFRQSLPQKQTEEIIPANIGDLPVKPFWDFFVLELRPFRARLSPQSHANLPTSPVHFHDSIYTLRAYSI